MKASELFGVVVRVIGLIMTMCGVWQISFAILNLVGGGPVNVIVMSLCGIPALLVGLWFLRGATSLILFAYYPEDK